MEKTMVAKNLRWLSVLLVLILALACLTVPALADEVEVPVNNYSSFAELQDINIMNYVTDVKLIVNPGSNAEVTYEPGSQIIDDQAISTENLVRFQFSVNLTGAVYSGAMQKLDRENSHYVQYANPSMTYINDSEGERIEAGEIVILDDSDITKQYVTAEGDAHVFLDMDWLDKIATSTDKVNHYAQLSVEYNKDEKLAYIYWPNDKKFGEKQPLAEDGTFYVDVYLKEGVHPIKLPDADTELLPGLDKDDFVVEVRGNESSGSYFNYSTNYKVTKNWVGFSNNWKKPNGKDITVSFEFTMNLEGGHTLHVPIDTTDTFRLSQKYPDDASEKLDTKDPNYHEYKLLSIDVREITPDGCENFIGTVTSPYDKVFEWKVTNTEKTKLYISKSIKNGSSNVSGAELALYRIVDGKEVLVTSWTSGSQPKEITDVLPNADGHFVLVETKAPENCVPLTEPVKAYFDVKSVKNVVDRIEYQTYVIDIADNSKDVLKASGNPTDGFQLELLNEYDKVKLHISKSIVDGASEVAGAELVLKDAAGNIIDEWTSEAGKENSREIEVSPGTYRLEEKVAPRGCEPLSSYIEFKVDEDLNVTTASKDCNIEQGTTARDYDMTVLNYPEMTKFSISKGILLDDNNVKEVAGAKMVLTREGDAEPVKSWTSVAGRPETISVLPGKYTLTETQAPDGCVKLETAITFTLTENFKVTDLNVNDEVCRISDGSKADGYKITVLNQLNEVSIAKTDVADIARKEIPGAHLTVTNKATGEVVDEWVSEKKSHPIKGLAPGNYTLTETQAPDGYEFAESIDFTVDEDGKVKDRIEMVDAPINLEISKKAINGSDELPGATLQIKDGDKVLQQWVSGETAKTVSMGFVDAEGNTSLIKIGKEYTLVETQAPAGYLIAEEIKFKVDKDGTVVIGGKDTDGESIVMRDALSKIIISKVDGTNYAELKDAVLEIRDAKGVVAWTNANADAKIGPYTVEGLPCGTYTLYEVKVPNGYQKAAPIEFTISDRGAITAKGGKVNGTTLTMTDMPTEAVISKVDATNNSKEIPGAHLTVTNKATGEVVDEWVSEEKPHPIKGLAPGDYILTETQAPDGYEITESIVFTVDVDGKVKEPIVMKDEPIVLEISKRMLNGTDELPGATLQIKDGDKVLQEWVSGTAPKSISVNFVGTDGRPTETIQVDKQYTLVEITAPAGYLRAEEIKFTVNEKGEVSAYCTNDKGYAVEGNMVIMYDDYTRVVISKIDNVYKKELSGATLEIQDTDGNVVWTNAHMDKKMGPYAVNALVPGTYKLVEVKAPSGYKLADPIEFTVEDNGIALEKVMVDVRVPVEPTPTPNPGPDPAPKPTPTPVRPVSPKTGDNSGVVVVLSVMSALTLIGVNKKRKKEM